MQVCNTSLVKTQALKEGKQASDWKQRMPKKGKNVEGFGLVFCQMCERVNRGGGK